MKEFSCHLCTASHFNLVQTSLMLVNTFDFNTCKLKMNWCPSPTSVGQVGPDSRPSARSDLIELVRILRTSRTRVGHLGQCRTCRTRVGQVGQSRTSRTEVGHSLLRSYTVVQPVSTWMQHITTQRAPLPLFLSPFSFFLFGTMHNLKIKNRPTSRRSLC